MVNGINLANVASVIVVLKPFHDREEDEAQSAESIIASSVGSRSLAGAFLRNASRAANRSISIACRTLRSLSA